MYFIGGVRKSYLYIDKNTNATILKFYSKIVPCTVRNTGAKSAITDILQLFQLFAVHNSTKGHPSASSVGGGFWA